MPAWSAPDGWEEINSEFLQNRRTEPPRERVLKFFDGAWCSWGLALHPNIIPRRGIVNELVDEVKSTATGGKPGFLLLLGSGGEGKSTVLLQSLVCLQEQAPSFRILWQAQSGKELSGADIISLPSGPWVIASDDADQVAKAMVQRVQQLHGAGRTDVSFLLVSRHSDWQVAWKNLIQEGIGTSLRDISHFQEFTLEGLKEQDARVIVESWEKYGAEGLGNLSGRTVADATRLLVAAATHQAEREDGAFFGALLETRMGGHLLEDHLRTLLDSFGRIPLSSQTSHTLRDAFAYIAAMHAEGQRFLSAPVLTYALGLEQRHVRLKVLAPLGRESVGTQAGKYLLTRHQAIAKTAIRLLDEEYHEDIDQLFVTLVNAAASLAFRERQFVDELSSWIHKLSEYFISQGRTALAIKIAAEVYDIDSSDSRCVVHLANTCRKAGDLGLARHKMEQFPGIKGRDFYHEWSIIEEELGEKGKGAVLQAFSLSDQCAFSMVDNTQGKQSLASLGRCLRSLYEAFYNNEILNGICAVAFMGGLLILDLEAEKYFAIDSRYCRNNNGAVCSDLNEALSYFESAIRTASIYCTDMEGLKASLGLETDMSWSGLRGLLERAAYHSR